MPRTPVRRTKIVATLGPAWDQPAQMAALLDAGVNVVRINASHGTPEIRARWIEQLREVTRRTRRDSVGDPARPAGAADPGRRRCRSRSGSTAGQTVVFAPEDEAAAGEIPTTYDDLAADVRVGARILLDDGLLALEVTGIHGQPGGRGGALRRRAQVAQGHEPSRDRGERAGAHREGPRGRRRRRRRWAWTTSRSRSSAGPRTWSSSARWCRARTKLIAKIEKDTALQNLCGILDASDAIMVARGDLGVELPFEEVPLMQKQIIREASLHGKPVITATQMLESMVHAPAARPGPRPPTWPTRSSTAPTR